MTSFTTIPVKAETKERLKKFAKKYSYFGESWDSVINRLLDVLEEKTSEH